MSISIVDIPVSQLMPNPHNPRRDVGDVRELADSIRAQGIKQELLVTPAGDRDGVPQYRVVIGHRRLAAARLAGRDMVPCRIEELTPREERELMLVENTQRMDLTPLEESDGYQGLLDLGVKVKEMAVRTGRSMRLVRGRLKIASIPRSVREASPSFAQLSLRELEDIAEFDGDEKAQARLASKAGCNDFEWQLNRLRRERDRRKWVEAALLWAESNDLPMLPDNLKPEDAWANPTGYEYQKRFGQDYPGPFSKQWKDWMAEGSHPGVVISILEDAGSVVAYTPARKTVTKPDEQAEAKRRMERETPAWDQGARPGVGRTALRMDPNNRSRVEGGRAARHDGTSDPVGADGCGRFDERHEPGLERVDPRGQGVLPVRQTVAGSGQGPGAWRVHAQRGGERPGAAPPPVGSLPSGRGASAAPAGPQGGRDRREHVGPRGRPVRPQGFERLLRGAGIGRLRGVGRGEEGAGAVNTKVVIRVRNGDDAPVSVERLVVDSRAEVGAGVTPMLLSDMLALLDDSCHVTDVEIRRAEP